MKKKIQPLGKNVLVKVKKSEETSEGGIIIPKTASEEKSQEGEIAAVGTSEKIPAEIKKGILVLYKKYSGTEVEIEKEEYVVLDATEDILAVIS